MRHRHRQLAWSFVLLPLGFPTMSTSAHAQDASTAYVSTEAAPDRFPLVSAGRAATIVVSSQDSPGVHRAATSLVSDVERVTGTQPRLLVTAAVDGLIEGGFDRVLVLVGTIGQSPLIDRLVREGRLDVSLVAGRRETFVLQSIERPLPGVDRALVIAGSDRRGTIFGIYDLSLQIGVSPWYWWADVPVERRSQLFVLPGAHTQGEPEVKLRGFFINDEAPALAGWAHAKFGGFNHRFYANVFELLLRMKGNFLWPAMWGRAFYDDDSMNAMLADEYGIVIGTSHHEPMMRAHVEWERYGTGAWNYETNPDVLRKFWRDGIVRMGGFEGVVTLGMRGDGDMPMSRSANIELLERIVRDQREILADVTGRAVTEMPQVWALYKEVQDYYDRGMRVPDDVTLLFADDNWGNIRRLPRPGDAPRAGGYGVYYHFDYVGGPRNYKWINTNQIERTWEQMQRAYVLGANEIWIVNVGDIKPMEFPLEFFMDHAWNPGAWNADRVADYGRTWAARQFGAAHAAEIAQLLNAYTLFNARRKPELLSPTTYSLTHYGEAERVVAEYDALTSEANRIRALLPDEYHDAYYQLVLYPIAASATINDLYVTVAKNRQYAAQGRALTNELASRAEALFARDAQMSAFYNDTLAGGKWPHMMDQTRIGYTIWQQPPENIMPAVMRHEVPEAAVMGVAIEGSDAWWPQSADAATLREIDVYAQQSRTIDVFNRGRTPFEYSVRASVPWLRVEPASGRIDAEQRLRVSVDWARVPTGKHAVPITITGAGTTVVVNVAVRSPATPLRDQVAGFVESNGHVSIEAEHYTRAVGTGGVRWTRVANLGRTLSAMTALPFTASVERPGSESPRLEYRMHLFGDAAANDSVTVIAYFSPGLDYNDLKGLRYGISFNDEPPQMVDMLADTTDRAWNRAVADNIRIATSRHRLTMPGDHVLKFWLVDPGLVLQKIVIDVGGLEPSYLGPPESYYRMSEPRRARVDDPEGT